MSRPVCHRTSVYVVWCMRYNTRNTRLQHTLTTTRYNIPTNRVVMRMFRVVMRMFRVVMRMFSPPLLPFFLLFLTWSPSVRRG